MHPPQRTQSHRFILCIACCSSLDRVSSQFVIKRKNNQNAVLGIVVGSTFRRLSGGILGAYGSCHRHRRREIIEDNKHDKKHDAVDGKNNNESTVEQTSAAGSRRCQRAVVRQPGIQDVGRCFTKHHRPQAAKRGGTVHQDPERLFQPNDAERQQHRQEKPEQRHDGQQRLEFFQQPQQQQLQQQQQHDEQQWLLRLREWRLLRRLWQLLLRGSQNEHPGRRLRLSFPGHRPADEMGLHRGTGLLPRIRGIPGHQPKLLRIHRRHHRTPQGSVFRQGHGDLPEPTGRVPGQHRRQAHAPRRPTVHGIDRGLVDHLQRSGPDAGQEHLGRLRRRPIRRRGTPVHDGREGLDLRNSQHDWAGKPAVVSREQVPGAYPVVDGAVFQKGRSGRTFSEDVVRSENDPSVVGRQAAWC
mmetsp:Transcript_3615/g.7902  ORF Transcript_3615/g.7902 Transcript_3615/m.7902 type:complete len:412 (-) Transcript_3615:427-1662(-)